ncbi:M3 family oligoendopeptidase [Campylobacter insulaenigrae]|uniref:M3 family oligoendopeptidase n=1 Tax=Campylobacter insulaenigrae TaxID=260714 RepID=A0ABY3G5W9_9BACT|nr:M3 family oligoendopeptidase [Campylobacter insulaenigrae]MCR6574280.1 M3 family oligoendopeptidase [Campylobacter insulaenigrae]MCR6579364.1 M3 family oligoendopeptidase [Campylobacter insulaenigrae]MCR6584900.1 M3 family oligoendopeptidase [Campylobacter insulaenigrae]MCR6586733.1 M3 family oligoendopeptidase [Campylobacter insulaenigrae]MCR6588241.1 M3 family oligoendopeptidase [Campylobacter insulaenigrae]
MKTWDLSILFKDEKELNLYIDELSKQTKQFKQNYENNLNSLNNENFLQALQKYENLILKLSHVLTYVYLIFAQDTTKGSFYAKYENLSKEIEENLLFFELEFCELSEEKSQDFINHCKNYAFYLENLIKHKQHNLSQKEERIILHLSNTGASAFSRLFDETFSALRFKFDGKKISEEEILSKLYDSDRSIRKKASKCFSKGLKKQNKLLVYIFNMIKTELSSICKLRAYENPETPRHIKNQISKKSVDALINSTENSFDLVAKFYNAKKKILGYKHLKDYDRYAPIGQDMQINFEDAKQTVLQAFKNFSTEFYNIANEAFNNGWIDVYPKDFKQSGAFSHSSTPLTHPYILLNFTNKRRDLFTLAHELGHTIHQKLSYNVSFLNQDTPLTTAETASVFAEMLIFDHIKEKLNKNELLSLYAAKIEDIFATLYRQINFTTFERKFHAKSEELNSKELSEIWMEESQKMFKDSVKLSKEYSLWYSYIPHFIHSPFYCYAYAYAQLLVLALYGLYKSKKCENFVQLYIKFLSSGGSKSPSELVSMFGFDIESDEFWNIGLEQVKKMVDEFLRLSDD